MRMSVSPIRLVECFADSGVCVQLGSRIPHHLKGKERATTISPPAQIRLPRSRSTSLSSSSSLSSYATHSEISFDTLRTFSAQRLGELCEMIYEQIGEMSDGGAEEESEALETMRRYLATLQEAFQIQLAAESTNTQAGIDVDSIAPQEEEEEPREVPFEESDSGGAVGQWSQNVIPYKRDKTSPNRRSPRQATTPPRPPIIDAHPAYPATDYREVQEQVNELDFAAILQSLADQRRVPVSVPNGAAQVVEAKDEQEKEVVDTLMDLQQGDIQISDSDLVDPSSIRSPSPPHDDNGPTSKGHARRRSSTPLRSRSPVAAHDVPSSPRPLSQADQDVNDLRSEVYVPSDDEEQGITPDENRPPRFEAEARPTDFTSESVQEDDAMQEEEEEEEAVISSPAKAIEEIDLLDTSSDDDEETIAEEVDELESPLASPSRQVVEAAATRSPSALVDYASSDESIPDQLVRHFSTL